MAKIVSGNRSPVVLPDVSLAPARSESQGRRRGRGGSGRGSSTLGRGGGGGNRGRRRGRGALIPIAAAAESEALVAQVDPVAQLEEPVATAGPSRLFNIPAGLEEASTNAQGVRRLRESVTSETDEPPSTRICTHAYPS